MSKTLRDHLVRDVGLRIVDSVKRTRHVAMFHELKQTEWLPREEHKTRQIERMRALLIHAYENVPYYTRLFDRRRFKPVHFNKLEDLQSLPVLTRHDVRTHSNELIARNAREFAPRLRATSGSTGAPLNFYASRDSHGAMWASLWRAFSIAGFELGQPLLLLAGGALMPNVTPVKQRIYMLAMGMEQLPAYHLSNGVMDGYIAALRKRTDNPILYAYASAAYLFARHVLKRDENGIRFRAIFTTSEVLTSIQRETIERAFSCPVFNYYGNNEGTLYAFECEEHDGMHYDMEQAYLEVLDDNGRPVTGSETGHLVATCLTNYAMPLIRYDTGDLGSVIPDKCKCGRGHIRIDRILGRSRDFIVTPQGRQVHGAFFNNFKPFYETPWIGAWYVLQDARDHLTIKLRPDGQPNAQDIEKIRAELRSALGSDLRIDVVLDKTLHLTAAAKQKLIESKVFQDGLDEHG